MRRACLAVGIAAVLVGVGCGGSSGTVAPVDGGGSGDGGRDGGAAPDADAPRCEIDDDCDDGDACNGAETCAASACVNGSDESDGTSCDLDENPATPDHCVNGACRAARCGDTYVDATASEQCDDGNDVLGDGCDDCRFTCEDDATCADGSECNGVETCTAEHTCVPGTALAEDAACADGTGACVSGACLARTCVTAADCDDGNVCNGAETCDPTSGCAVGTALECEDADACTADTCAPGSGCAHALVDADLDGHSPASLGECGDDCDDTDRDVSPDAVDICGDGIDNNCDETIDEGATTEWYADCDGDGYAAAGARMLTSCVRPSVGSSMCATGGGWTARAPGTEADCNDANATINPGQTMFQTTAIAGAPATSDYDYDCNATEERRDATPGSCAAAGLMACTTTEGWSGDAIPACGESGAFVVRCTAGLIGTCTAVTEMRVQACR